LATEFHNLSITADTFTMKRAWVFVDPKDPGWTAAPPSASQVDLRVDAKSGVDTLVIEVGYQSPWFFDLVPMTTPGVRAVLSNGSQVQFVNFEKLTFHGAFGDTTITLGTALNNTITGGALDDTFLYGFGGADRIDGKAGDDVINGGQGADVIIGNTGKDNLSGGTGNDKFKYSSAAESRTGFATRDFITDFAHGYDKIDVSAINGLSAASGFRTFKFVGTSSFSGNQGEIHYVLKNNVGTASDVTLVEGDIDLDRHADFQIALKGLIKLTAIDFVL
jgi:Ca2+-binding RTX toxin-like protein